MKNKIKKFFQNKIFLLILGIFIGGTTCVYAVTYFPSNQVTYNNSSSKLNATNVQGAIDELYNIAKQCNVNSNDKVEDIGGTVSSGDGLYEDKYEEGRYFYKGTNPNNYITFNNEKAGWRIISFEPDGTIKIIKNTVLSSTQYFNKNYSSNSFQGSTAEQYLNNTYYNTLTETAQNQIVSNYFNAGFVTYLNSDLSSQIKIENEVKWKGNIGLITVSEYLRANSNTNQCETFKKNNDNYYSCKNTNWMYLNSVWWTISPYESTFYSEWLISNDSKFQSGVVAQSIPMGGFSILGSPYYLRPVVFLKSDIKISGNGTQSDPYTLS